MQSKKNLINKSSHQKRFHFLVHSMNKNNLWRAILREIRVLFQPQLKLVHPYLVTSDDFVCWPYEFIVYHFSACLLSWETVFTRMWCLKWHSPQLAISKLNRAATNKSFMQSTNQNVSIYTLRNYLFCMASQLIASSWFISKNTLMSSCHNLPI